MDSNSNDDIQYLVPQNVKARFTFFEGFGWKELFICLIGVVISVLIFLILSLFVRKIILRFLLCLFPTAIAFVISKENPRTGLSLMKLLKDFREYLGQQKLYLYYYGKGRD